MNRRTFLQQSGWLTAGTWLLPGLFHSCKKLDWDQDNTFQGEVIIVGAGISGLYAAEMLLKQGVSVQILEASDYWGGRMRTLPNASPLFQQADRRTVYGQFSILYDLLRHQSIEMPEKSGSQLYSFAGALNTEAEANQNIYFQEMLQAVENLNTYNGGDISAHAYFDALGISSNVEAAFNVLAGQVHGTSADRISAVGIGNQYQSWSAGKTEFTLSGNQLQAAIEQAFPNALNRIRYNTAVSSIDYSGAKVSIQDQSGGTYSCDRILLTAPLNVLKSGAISFTPALNSAKQTSLSRIGIDRSYCAMFKLQTAIWPSGTRKIIGNNIAQSFEVTDDGWVYTEVSGAQADMISSIFGDPLNIIQQQFNQLFPGAISLITDSAIHTWQGNRSYDPIGVGEARQLLASSINQKLFFAGEATHTGGHHGTLHGAMETALRAATEILTSSAS